MFCRGRSRSACARPRCPLQTIAGVGASRALDPGKFDPYAVPDPAKLPFGGTFTCCLRPHGGAFRLGAGAHPARPGVTDLPCIPNPAFSCPSARLQAMPSSQSAHYSISHSTVVAPDGEVATAPRYSPNWSPVLRLADYGVAHTLSRLPPGLPPAFHQYPVISSGLVGCFVSGSHAMLGFPDGSAGSHFDHAAHMMYAPHGTLPQHQPEYVYSSSVERGGMVETGMQGAVLGRSTQVADPSRAVGSTSVPRSPLKRSAPDHSPAPAHRAALPLQGGAAGSASTAKDTGEAVKAAVEVGAQSAPPARPAKKKRHKKRTTDYVCGECGQQKRGHTCPMKFSRANSKYLHM